MDTEAFVVASVVARGFKGDVVTTEGRDKKNKVKKWKRRVKSLYFNAMLHCIVKWTPWMLQTNKNRSSLSLENG